MRWLKTYEAKANHYRNAKLKALRRKNQRILPTLEEVHTLAIKYLFDEEYNNKCDEYIIPHMDLDITKYNQRTVNLNPEDDKFTGFINLKLTSSKASADLSKDESISIERLYGDNFPGICRLMNDYYTGKITKPIVDETKKMEDGIEVPSLHGAIHPEFKLLINIIGGNTCLLMFRYNLKWFKYAAITTNNYEPKLTRETDLNIKDVIQFIDQEFQNFKKIINTSFYKFEIDFMDRIEKEIMKQLREDTKELTYAEAQILKHYPVLINKLGLNITDVENGSGMQGMGFGD
jgi:hypothetical protein